MKSKFPITLWAVISYTGFLAAWGVSLLEVPSSGTGGDIFHHIFRGIVFLGIAGIALPMVISRKFGLNMTNPDVPTKRFMIGTFALLAAAAIGVFLSGSFEQIMEDRPPALMVLKYILLLAPMAMALTLQCFFIIPSAVTSIMGGHNSAMSGAIIISALSIGLCFFVDSGFVFSGYAVIMTVLGLLLGTGAVLTGSVYLTALMLFLILLSNFLAGDKYFDYPWYALLTGFLFCGAAFLLLGRGRLRG